jgi:hypothetical protein
LWLLALIPTLDLQSLRRVITISAGGLPVLFVVLGTVGMFWADVPWAERLGGMSSFVKFLVIPLLLQRIDHLYRDPHEQNVRFTFHYGDMTDATNLIRIIQETQPTEIYNLAAQSHVQVSFETPEYTANADALSPLRLLEAIRILGLEKREDGFCADAHTPPDGNP